MKRVYTVCALLGALWAGACSGGGSTVITPPPNNGFSNNSLLGQYAFSMSGTTIDPTTGVPVPFTRIGSFSANGEGVITGGVEDVNLILAGEGFNELAFSNLSSYSINSDGRGTLTLVDSTGSLSFSVTMSSSSGGYLVLMPTDLLSAGNGSFTLQSPNSFTLSAFSGPYAFDFSGVDPSGNPESIVGQLVSNGNLVLSGFADDNDAGTVNGGTPGATQISGSYSMPPIASDLTNFGRAVFSIGGITGVFYIVGPNEVMFLEGASGGTLAGAALLQSNVPTTAANVSGGFVYVMGGSDPAGALTRGGKFSASGGNLTSIIVDDNNAGQNGSNSTTTGTYTIDSTVPGSGRGTVTFKVPGLTDTFSYVFYMVSPTQAYIQDQSQDIVEDGSLFAQGSGTITNSSLAGNYALNWSGVTITNSNSSGEEDVVGETTVSSSAGFTGTVDINEFSTDTQATGITLSGGLTLSADPTSHNAVTITLATNPAGKVTAFAYIAANNNILILTTQSTRIAAGVLTPQTP
jgi:hypothetical protein